MTESPHRPPLFSNDISSSCHQRLPSQVHPTPRPLVHGLASHPRAYFVGHWDACKTLSCQRLCTAHPSYPFKLTATTCYHSSSIPFTAWACLPPFLTCDIIIISFYGLCSTSKTCVCHMVSIQWIFYWMNETSNKNEWKNKLKSQENGGRLWYRRYFLHKPGWRQKDPVWPWWVLGYSGENLGMGDYM